MLPASSRTMFTSPAEASSVLMQLDAGLSAQRTSRRRVPAVTSSPGSWSGSGNVVVVVSGTVVSGMVVVSGTVVSGIVVSGIVVESGTVVVVSVCDAAVPTQRQ